MSDKVIVCPRCGTQEEIEISRQMETTFTHRIRNGKMYKLPSPIHKPVGEFWLYCSKCGQEEEYADDSQWKVSPQQNQLLQEMMIETSSVDVQKYLNEECKVKNSLKCHRNDGVICVYVTGQEECHRPKNKECIREKYEDIEIELDE
jgi:hypothetical protein